MAHLVTLPRLVFIFLSLMRYVDTSGKLKVYLYELVNHDNRLIDGTFCDGSQNTHCDVYFKFCLFREETVDMSRYRCPRADAQEMTRMVTFEGEVIDFRKVHNLGNGLKNPLIWKFKEWTQVMTLYIEAWDSDFATVSDFVDYYKLPLIQHPEVLQKAGFKQIITTKGKRQLTPSALTLALEIKCDEFFYGNKCSTYCKEMNNDIDGHYTCNSTTGEKVCRENWYGSSCQYPCTLPNTTSENFLCNKTGNIICKEGWYGIFCNVSCSLDLSSSSHYKCTIKGTKVCEENWYGTNCTVYCKPIVNSLRSYDCASNGSKLCHKHWYGGNCSIFCKVQNNLKSRYQCLSNGTKLCLPHWYGSHCSVYCKPKTDHSQSYTCNRKGQKICSQYWYGENCSTYCGPRLGSIINAKQNKNCSITFGTSNKCSSRDFQSSCLLSQSASYYFSLNTIKHTLHLNSLYSWTVGIQNKTSMVPSLSHRTVGGKVLSLTHSFYTSGSNKIYHTVSLAPSVGKQHTPALARSETRTKYVSTFVPMIPLRTLMNTLLSSYTASISRKAMIKATKSHTQLGLASSSVFLAGNADSISNHANGTKTFIAYSITRLSVLSTTANVVTSKPQLPPKSLCKPRLSNGMMCGDKEIYMFLALLSSTLIIFGLISAWFITRRLRKRRKVYNCSTKVGGITNSKQKSIAGTSKGCFGFAPSPHSQKKKLGFDNELHSVLVRKDELMIEDIEDISMEENLRNKEECL